MNTQASTIKTRTLSFTLLDRLIIAFFQKAIKKGKLNLELGNKQFTITGEKFGTEAHLKINSLKFFPRTILKGDIGLAEAYKNGEFNTNDLTKLFLLALQNLEGFSKFKDGSNFAIISDKIFHSRNKNTIKGSKENIHKHYDLGNEFFQLWLDPSMTYSSAWFNNNLLCSLQDAQLEKYNRILDNFNLQPGQHILEIGCGWGGFAEAAAKKGIKVTGITISQEQFDYATARMKRENLQNLVDIELRDYRTLEGKYDGIVSIEMIEAVGEEYWPVYFKKISELLKPNGKAMIQAITMNERDFPQYRVGTDFIQRYIFPGGMLIPTSKISENCENNQLSLLQVDEFGMDYAETLRRWQIKFNEKSALLKSIGFDDYFQKIWNFYFSYCQAGFLHKKIGVSQNFISKKGEQ